MTYADYRAKTAEIANSLPVFWAFSEEQFDKELAKRGITRKSAPKKLYSFPMGGFYLRSDADKVKKYYEDMANAKKELVSLMENEEGFAYEAFEYEMYNHEYPINWQGDWDVCSCFGKCEYGDGKYGEDYLKELGFSNKVIKEYAKASRAVRANGDW